MKIRDHAKGKWGLIISEILGPEFAEKTKHQPCPTGQGKDCFRFSDQAGTGTFFCKCSGGDKDGFDLLMCTQGWDFSTAAKQVEEIIGAVERDEPEKEHWSFRYAREAKTIDRNAQYLMRRNLYTPSSLLWHPAFPYIEEGRVIKRFPAMVAPIRRGDRVIAHHVTYLFRGEKAPVETPRKILGGKNLKGSAVHLQEPGRVLGIAEGIETALSAQQLFGVATWAALNTSLLQSFEPPAGVSKVVIFGDHDRNFAGHAAAYQLAHRLSAKGVAVELRFPEKPGTDWNDVLMDEIVIAERRTA